VVEDEAHVRIATERALTRLGYTVLTAENGEDGWRVFQQHGDSIRLVISDSVMPRLGGSGLLQRIRSNGHVVPFLLSTGYSEEANRPFDISVPVLPKPWTVADLARSVRQLLDTRRA
jgi:two-component system cell cycle sensor histidine kinase/response regulator CckA